ncbi:MAG: hypothetical protein K1X66_01000 [Verrucomicrobiae bacterium]|nr:hypothetical protein [Verrucomicrobiae bacterium]
MELSRRQDLRVKEPIFNIIDDILRNAGQRVEPHTYGSFIASLRNTFADQVPDRIKNMSQEEALQELKVWDDYREFTAAKRLTFSDSVTYLQVQWRLEQIQGKDETGKSLTPDEINQRYEQKLEALNKEFKFIESTTPVYEGPEDVGPQPY